jgi:isopenicillin-N N-acyltransferase-like protein
MTLPHQVSLESSPAARGRAFGRARQAEVACTIHAYRQLFQRSRGVTLDDVRRAGQLVGERLAVHYPSLVDEIEGIADGSGHDLLELLAINARTELLAGSAAPECTVLGLPAPGSGNPVLAQNWDFHPDVRDARVLWTVRAGERWFTTFTEAGILAKIGLNSHGLGVCLNLLSTDVDGGSDGLPIHVLLRLLLQNCGSVAEAVDLCSRVSVSASSCITVGEADDATSRIVSLELTPGHVGLIDPTDDRLVHTNHCLDLPRDRRDLTVNDWPDTRRRLVTGKALLQEDWAPAQHVVATALRSHDNDPTGICRHDSANPSYVDRCETLASVLIDLHDRRIWVSDGPPCRVAHEPVKTGFELPRGSP